MNELTSNSQLIEKWRNINPEIVQKWQRILDDWEKPRLLIEEKEKSPKEFVALYDLDGSTTTP